MSSSSSGSDPVACLNADGGNWRAIVEDNKEGVIQTIDAIEADISRRADSIVQGPSLAGGSAGLAVFYAYLAQAKNDARLEELAMQWLERSIADIARGNLSTALYSGLTGVGWTLAHLSCLEDRVDDEQFTMVDELLAELLEAPVCGIEYDLVNGLVGVGVYALERLPSPKAIGCLEQVIEILEQQAMHTPDGVTWRTPKARLQPRELERSMVVHANLGVAHGVPGIVGLLAQAVLHGVAVERSRALLRLAVSWLLSQRLAENPVGRFLYSIPSPGEPQPARLAWCYGDLGIACVLLAAARADGNDAWQAEGLQLALTAARRPWETSGVEDAGLCHGAGGAGHLFNRLHQATNEPELLEASRGWFARMLAFRSPETGVGGFSAMRIDGAGCGSWHEEPGLLEGAAGVALALLAAVTTAEPNWDRMLLCALPPARV